MCSDTQTSSTDRSDEGFSMAGTERTFEYVVVAVTSTGRVGFRELNGHVRVRLEPRQDAEVDTSTLVGWKTPDTQFRYSTVVESGPAVVEAVEKALAVIGIPPGVEFNPEASVWREKFASEPEESGDGTVAVPRETLEALVETLDQLSGQLRELASS